MLYPKGEHLAETQLQAIDTLLAPYENVDVVILATHSGVVEDYASHIAKRWFGRDGAIFPYVRKGTGLHLDKEAGIVSGMPRE